MSTYGIYDEDLFEDDQIRQAQNKYNRNISVTQDQANYASSLLQQYPDLSPSVVVAVST